jgi:hypothetical protein
VLSDHKSCSRLDVESVLERLLSDSEALSLAPPSNKPHFPSRPRATAASSLLSTGAPADLNKSQTNSDKIYVYSQIKFRPRLVRGALVLLARTAISPGPPGRLCLTASSPCRISCMAAPSAAAHLPHGRVVCGGASPAWPRRLRRRISRMAASSAAAHLPHGLVVCLVGASPHPPPALVRPTLLPLYTEFWMILRQP